MDHALPSRPHSYPLYRNPDLLLDKLDILLCVFRELFVRLTFADRRFPARQCLVLRFHTIRR